MWLRLMQVFFRFNSGDVVDIGKLCALLGIHFSLIANISILCIHVTSVIKSLWKLVGAVNVILICANYVTSQNDMFKLFLTISNQMIIIKISNEKSQVGIFKFFLSVFSLQIRFQAITCSLYCYLIEFIIASAILPGDRFWLILLILTSDFIVILTC